MHVQRAKGNRDEAGRAFAKVGTFFAFGNIADRLATEALKAMQSGHVNGLLVVEENGMLIGGK